MVALAVTPAVLSLIPIMPARSIRRSKNQKKISIITHNRALQASSKATYYTQATRKSLVALKQRGLQMEIILAGALVISAGVAIMWAIW